MESEGFRIKLNLSEFFTDKRKCSYIFIELNKINDFYDLERRIRCIFAITENIIFLIDDVFVPLSENIKLIHEEETLTLAAETIGLGEFGVNADLRTRKSQHSQIKNERKRKQKVLVCQDECRACFHNFQTKCCHDFHPQKKRKKMQSLNKCNEFQYTSYPCMKTDTIIPNAEIVELHDSENEMFLRENKVYDFDRNKHGEINDTPILNKKKVLSKKVKKNKEKKTVNNETENNSIKDCFKITSNATDNFYFKEPDYIMQKQETDRNLSHSYDINETAINRRIESHNKVNGMYPIEIDEDHSKECMTGHKKNDRSKADSSEMLGFDDAKMRIKELISAIKLKSDTNLMGKYDEGQQVDLSENHEYVHNKETSLSMEDYNIGVKDLLINDSPISTHTVNVENCHERKRTRIRKVRRKHIVQQAALESPNIIGLIGTNPETNHVRITDVLEEHTNKTSSEISSVKETLNEISEAKKCIKQNCVDVKAEDNVPNKTYNSTYLREFSRPLPTKSEAFLARIKAPNPVDICRKLLSPSVVLNRMSCNSKLFQDVTPVDKEEHIIIDSEEDDYINLEKYHLINSSPRKGDIIAFKLNRVTSDCIPYITEYIVAEVLKFCDDSSQIKVKVQRGLDQLQEPHRRLSLFENVEESYNKNDTYEFNWNELLETRLLYP